MIVLSYGVLWRSSRGNLGHQALDYRSNGVQTPPFRCAGGSQGLPALSRRCESTPYKVFNSVCLRPFRFLGASVCAPFDFGVRSYASVNTDARVKYALFPFSPLGFTSHIPLLLYAVVVFDFLLVSLTTSPNSAAAHLTMSSSTPCILFNASPSRRLPNSLIAKLAPLKRCRISRCVPLTGKQDRQCRVDVICGRCSSEAIAAMKGKTGASFTGFNYFSAHALCACFRAVSAFLILPPAQQRWHVLRIVPICSCCQ